MDQKPTIPEPVRPESVSSYQAQRARKLADIKAARRMDALSLYESLPNQDEFHRNKAWQRVCRGGNRAGKTACCAVECARVALDRDPYKKYPPGPKLIYLIGYDQDHIGRVFHRVLFRKGLFKIIRDEATGMWRAYRPSQDSHRENEAYPSPPLIPPEMIAEEPGWGNKKERVFTVIRLTNGTEIRAFSSKAEAPQGDPVDYIWIDEDIDDESWVPELQARLSDKKGRLVWSAFPQSANDALYTLSQRAAEEAELGREPPDVHEVVLVYSQNPFIDAEQRRLRLADFASMSPEELAARDRGQFLTDSILMYPMFHPRTHGAPQFYDGETPSDFELALKDGQVPAEWSRYLSIDPGFTTAAVLFFAVPPPFKYGDHVLLYDELYLRQCTADMLANAIAQKQIGQHFRGFVIDERGSRQSNAGSGMDVKEQYSRSFRAHRVESELTGNSFISGSDDRQARASMVRTWLSIRPDGTCKFRYLTGRCPNFEKEITQKYRKNQLKDKTFEDVASAKAGLKCHAMAAFEYMAAYEPRYAPPRKPKSQYSPIYQAHLNELKQAKARNGSGVSLGVGNGRYSEGTSNV